MLLNSLDSANMYIPGGRNFEHLLPRCLPRDNANHYSIFPHHDATAGHSRYWSTMTSHCRHLRIVKQEAEFLDGQERNKISARCLRGKTSRCLQDLVSLATILVKYNRSQTYRDEAKKQTDRYPHSKHLGFTKSDGGYDAAKKSFKEYERWKQSTLTFEEYQRWKQSTLTEGISESVPTSPKRKEQPDSWQEEEIGPRKTPRTAHHDGMLDDHRGFTSSNGFADENSEAGTDYGEFPADLDFLDHERTCEIKVEPNGHGEASTDWENPGSEPVLKLCEEQRDLVELILSGANVFYTGPAGCGKSAVLKTIVSVMKSRQQRVRVVAYTGRAALEANGCTLHSYGGWTPESMAKPIEKLKRAANGRKNWKRFNSTDVLVMDEISMVENHVFERLNHVMQHARNNDLPFGGVQLIVTGDFFQLPPVKPFQHCLQCGQRLGDLVYQTTFQCQNEECTDFEKVFNESDRWAFRSSAWERCKFNHFALRKVHRQEDARFLDLLGKCRIGLHFSTQGKAYLEDRCKEHDVLSKRNSCIDEAGPVAIKLFSRKDDVAAVNEGELGLIEKECLEFNCLDRFDWNPKHEDLQGLSERGAQDGTLKAFEEHSFEASLEVKQGMPVILLVNLDQDAGLINGSQGILLDYEKYDPERLPKLSGAHKGRRQNLVREFAARAQFKKWPVVSFGGLRRTIYPVCMMSERGDIKENEDESHYSLLSRTQVPLAAAWAITIHKCQGMTLERAEVHLAKAWEQAAIYVALSRVRKPEGLTVASWPTSTNSKGPNAEVVRFMKEKGLWDINPMGNGPMKKLDSWLVKS